MSKKKSSDEMTDHDVAMAFELHQRYYPLGLTENAVFSQHKKAETYEPKTLVDRTLEIVDPTPNIYTLFAQFDARFFSSKLLSVEVKWSQRMTSCAGVCSFHPRSRECTISLSAPLLKLRPRKDLVETLLHEMIHGYLFLTNNNRDRDGHGPEFRKIMDRINKEAGTRISVYHSFHDEVRLYQQHWWRCDGPCQRQSPFFGMVRRAMNRAPGPSDFWWDSHRRSCNGSFVKVREPAKKSKTISRAKSHDKPAKEAKSFTPSPRPERRLDDWLTRPGENFRSSGATIKPSDATGTRTNDVYQRKIVKTDGLVKLGTSTNNVHGWGIAGPGSTASSKTSNSSYRGGSNDGSARSLNFAGTLGGAGSGRSNLLDKFSTAIRVDNGPKNGATSTRAAVVSPVAKKPKIMESRGEDGAERSSNVDSKIFELYDCPVCNSSISSCRLNDHLDLCLVNESETRANTKRSRIIEIRDSPEKLRAFDRGETSELATKSSKGQTDLDAFVVSSKNKDTKNPVSCPICDKIIAIVDLYDHLDSCSDDFSFAKNPKPKAQNLPKITIAPNGAKANNDATYVCLVCSVNVPGNIELSEHLEECVQAIFSDDTFDVGNESITEISSPKAELADVKFPCPVCMDLIRENFMNDHLDLCLLSNK